MKEDDIRPVSVMDLHQVAIQEDIDRLLSRIDEFVLINCPACSTSTAKPLYSKNGFNYVRCSCGTAYMNPRPSQKTLSWFYKSSSNYKYWSENIYPKSEIGRVQHIIKPRVDKVLELCQVYNISCDSLLEVGCAYGSFCVEMAAQGVWKNIVGIEPTPDLANKSRQRGVSVFEGMIEEYSNSSKELFDVIVAFEVIEHVFNPEEIVSSLSDLLKPDGILILTCPNIEGFDIDLLRERSTSVDHEHLNYFSASSLLHLYQRLGLTPVASFTPGRLDAELVRKSVLAGEYCVEDQPFLKKVLVDQWGQYGGLFQNFLANAGLSSHLWAVAKK